MAAAASSSTELSSPAHISVVAPSSGSSSLRDFFTILALSFHAVFEGLAVGLEDSTEGVWTLFAGALLLI
jgi:zinc transporter ZupT